MNDLNVSGHQDRLVTDRSKTKYRQARVAALYGQLFGGGLDRGEPEPAVRRLRLPATAAPRVGPLVPGCLLPGGLRRVGV